MGWGWSSAALVAALSASGCFCAGLAVVAWGAYSAQIIQVVTATFRHREYVVDLSGFARALWSADLALSTVSCKCRSA